MTDKLKPCPQRGGEVTDLEKFEQALEDAKVPFITKCRKEGYTIDIRCTSLQAHWQSLDLGGWRDGIFLHREFGNMKLETIEITSPVYRIGFSRKGEMMGCERID